MTDFFTLIGNALVKELQRRRLARAPLGLVVHLDTWEHPNPRFEVWPCPGNLKGVWGATNRASRRDVKDMHMALNYIDIAASQYAPFSMDIESPPSPSSIGPGVDMFNRFSVDPITPMIPERGLSQLWDKLVELPNVALDADYVLSSGGLRSSVYLTFLTRFAQHVQDAGYKNLNKHLLKRPLPGSWVVLMTPSSPSSNKRKRSTDDEDYDGRSEIIVTIDDEPEEVEAVVKPKRKKSRVETILS